MYTGSCLCGGIRFSIHSDLAPIQICHCMQCRKAQGGPFATNIPIDSDSFEVISGKQLLKRYESLPGKSRFFCSNCGSPVYSRRSSLPNVIRIRAGLLNEPLPVRPAFHAFVGSRCNWWPIDDGLPQYMEACEPEQKG